jgi:2'-5' RNA ligase
VRRLFFALPIDDSSKQAIANWRLLHFTEEQKRFGLKPVSRKNFHITLAFLGLVDEGQYHQLASSAGQIKVAAFSLCLDALGHFARPKVAYLSTTERPAALMLLASLLRKQALALDLRQDNLSYTPHLTLFRKARQPLNRQGCHFKLEFKRFALFESCSSDRGVQYHELASWPLLS